MKAMVESLQYPDDDQDAETDRESRNDRDGNGYEDDAYNDGAYDDGSDYEPGADDGEGRYRRRYSGIEQPGADEGEDEEQEDEYDEENDQEYWSEGESEYDDY